MTIRPILASCAFALGVAVVGADGRQDFNAAYAAYREAVAANRYGDALQHAEEARKLGESLYPEDLRKTATLVFNHGAVLGKLGRHDEAYPILKRARKSMRQAFGEGAPEMVKVEGRRFEGEQGIPRTGARSGQGIPLRAPLR